jgi:hypothetical protein
VAPSFRLLVAIVGTFLVTSLLPARPSSTTPDPYQQALESIVFIYPSGTHPCAGSENDPPLPLGTGFFVCLVFVGSDGKPTGEIERKLVTNKHIVTGRDALVLRLNSTDGKGCICHDQVLDRTVSKNVLESPRPEVDLAVIDVPNIAGTAPVAFGYETLMDEACLNELHFKEGSDIFTAGFFLRYAGNRRNYPLVRSGKLALLTHERWWRVQQDAPAQYAYLGELGTTYGASGSPVLLVPDKINVALDGSIHGLYVGARLLGVIKGIPGLPAETTIKVPTYTLAGSVPVATDVIVKGTTAVSNGLAAIEPATNLKQLLEPRVQQLIKQGKTIRGYGQESCR